MTTIGEGIASLGKSIGSGIEKGIEDAKKKKKQQQMMTQLDNIYGMGRAGGGKLDPNSELGNKYAISRMLISSGASDNLTAAMEAASKMYESVSGSQSEKGKIIERAESLRKEFTGLSKE